MAGGLDGFLNIAIPIGIVVFFGFTIYKPLKPQIDGLFAWIGNVFKNQMETNTTGHQSIIVYE